MKNKRPAPLGAGLLFFRCESTCLFRHESLSCCVRFAPQQLSVRDPASRFSFLCEKKISLRLGKRYVLCEGTVLKQKTYARRAGFLFYLFPPISLPGLRRVTINVFEYFFGFRVFCPFPVGRPCFVRDRLCPRGARPSPPPCG